MLKAFSTKCFQETTNISSPDRGMAGMRGEEVIARIQLMGASIGVKKAKRLASFPREISAKHGATLARPDPGLTWPSNC
jgi:hypothetical protein